MGIAHCLSCEVLGLDSFMNNIGRVLTPLCLGFLYGRKLGCRWQVALTERRGSWACWHRYCTEYIWRLFYLMLTEEGMELLFRRWLCIIASGSPPWMGTKRTHKNLEDELCGGKNVVLLSCLCQNSQGWFLVTRRSHQHCFQESVKCARQVLALLMTTMDSTTWRR